MIDEEGIVRVWTKGAEKIFSYPAEEILAETDHRFFRFGQVANHESLKQGHRLYRQQHQPRTNLFVLINTSPIYLDDQIIGAVGDGDRYYPAGKMKSGTVSSIYENASFRARGAVLSPPQDPFQSIKGSSKSMKNIVQLAKENLHDRSTCFNLGRERGRQGVVCQSDSRNQRRKGCALCPD